MTSDLEVAPSVCEEHLCRRKLLFGRRLSGQTRVMKESNERKKRKGMRKDERKCSRWEWPSPDHVGLTLLMKRRSGLIQGKYRGTRHPISHRTLQSTSRSYVATASIN